MRRTLWLAAPILALFLPFLAGDAHAANDNLYVSAENPAFGNHFAGTMVVEVVINDHDLRDTGSAVGEPDVTINGNDLRMVQGTDGMWYAYVADMDAARAADQIVADAGASGQSLDFGEFCSAADPVLGADFTDAAGVAIARAADGSANGRDSPSECTVITGGAEANNVVRSPKSINTNPGVAPGQIGLDAQAWPVIQLFSLNNAEIKYNRAGGTQQVNLEYDEMPNIRMELDRPVYPAGAQVFITIHDMQLNQDPTDEDSWTFGVGGEPAAFYQAFTESGSRSGDGGPGLINLNPHLTALGFEDNGQVAIETGSIIELRPNGNQPASSVSDGTATFENIATFVETRPNSGVFESHDTASESVIGMLPDARRGLAGSVQYNDRTESILSGTFTASVTLEVGGGQLAPGTRTTVTVTDSDQNVNSGKRDTLAVPLPSAIIPTLRMGEPLTLGAASDVRLRGANAPDAGAPVDSGTDDSDRLIIDASSAPDVRPEGLSIYAGYTASSLKSLLIEPGARGTNWLNYDFRSLQDLGAIDARKMAISLFFGGLDDSSPVEILAAGDAASPKGLVQLDDGAVGAILAKSGTAYVVVDLGRQGPGGAGSQAAYPIVMDLFSFGQAGRQEINNAIYRLELEETSPGSGVFDGTIEYAVTNQINILDPGLISTLRTIDQDVKFLVSGDLLDEDGITISYSDLDHAGVPTSTDAQSDVTTHSGNVELGSASYGFGRPVVITLNDPDLNLDDDTIETYHTISDPGSDNMDTVGTPGGGVLLEVEIKGSRYKQCVIGGVMHGGLAASGFALVETGADTGVFEGTFKMPSRICSGDGTRLISPAGGSIEVKYHDFRDAAGRQSVFSSAEKRLPAASQPVLDRSDIPLPGYGKTAEVVLSGTLGLHERGTPLSISILHPDGTARILGVMPNDGGSYQAVLTIRHDSPAGTYDMDVAYLDEQVGSVSFTVYSPEIPAWIKANAGLWGGGTITDSEFLDSIEYLASEGFIEASGSASPDRRLPGWMGAMAGWWSDGLISDDEFVTAVQFLVKKGIIRV